MMNCNQTWKIIMNSCNCLPPLQSSFWMNKGSSLWSGGQLYITVKLIQAHGQTPITTSHMMELDTTDRSLIFPEFHMLSWLQRQGMFSWYVLFSKYISCVIAYILYWIYRQPIQGLNTCLCPPFVQLNPVGESDGTFVQSNLQFCPHIILKITLIPCKPHKRLVFT